MSWGEIRLAADAYHDRMKQIEKRHARRAMLPQPARPEAPLKQASAWIKRLTLKLRGIPGARQGGHQDAPAAATDLLRQG